MAKINTYQKILNCAASMFAQHGYGGTIMDDLAELSGANKASIYYHHKDKITLYENTLTALFTPIADAVVEAVKVWATTSLESPFAVEDAKRAAPELRGPKDSMLSEILKDI